MSGLAPPSCRNSVLPPADQCFLEEILASQERSLPGSRDLRLLAEIACFPKQMCASCFLQEPCASSGRALLSREGLCFPKEISASEQRSLPPSRDRNASQSRVVLPRGDPCFLKVFCASEQRCLPPSRDHMHPEGDLCLPGEICSKSLIHALSRASIFRAHAQASSFFRAKGACCFGIHAQHRADALIHALHRASIPRALDQPASSFRSEPDAPCTNKERYF